MAGIGFIIQLNDPIAIPIITQSPLYFKKLCCSSNRQNRCRPFPRDKWLSKSVSDQTAPQLKTDKATMPAWYIWNRRKGSLHQGKIPSKKGRSPLHSGSESLWQEWHTCFKNYDASNVSSTVAPVSRMPPPHHILKAKTPTPFAVKCRFWLHIFLLLHATIFVSNTCF